MIYFLSCLFLLLVLAFIALFCYRAWLQCKVLMLQLPKRKKKTVKKVVLDDELSEG